MKLYVDDERPAPEGWTLAKTFHEAYALLSEEGHKFTHVSFDWMLSRERMVLNGNALLRELAYAHFLDEPVFTAPREAYTCHSSDPEEAKKMERILDAILSSESYQEYEDAIEKADKATLKKEGDVRKYRPTLSRRKKLFRA